MYRAGDGFTDGGSDAGDDGGSDAGDDGGSVGSVGSVGSDGSDGSHGGDDGGNNNLVWSADSDFFVPSLSAEAQAWHAKVIRLINDDSNNWRPGSTIFST